MPAAVQRPPAKRVLGDTRSNVLNSPRSAKKLKVENPPTKTGRPPIKTANGALLSTQPKSQFEQDVLEKMTQDINGLKQNNTERDQQWARPSLDDFDPRKDSLCFQQIEAEEGVIHGGKATVKLFGVTEVGTYYTFMCLG